MPDDTEHIPGATPSHYQRTTGGNLQWKPPTVERLQKLLSGYEVIEMLGCGGMGAVYKARQISLDRLVAIKILPPEAAGDDEENFVERFRNEARTMAKMNHPAIVSVYDFGETNEGQLYIVMEFVDGTDVSKMILSQGRLPAEYALAITTHVCDALQYAHTHGIIHRDIKPANILINMEGAVKVADFGLAKASDAGQGGLTQTNMAMGTPDFVAPEALISGMLVDGRADLYAVGVMLYNMLTGNIPRGMFRMPSTTVSTDPRFDKIIIKSMEMDREMRYQTAFDIRKDLDVILTTPHVEAGGQSIAAIPKQQHAQRPVAKAPQKPLGKSAKVPVRTEEPQSEEASAARPARGTSGQQKKTILGPIIGIAATVLIAGGLAFMFMGKDKPAAASSSTSTNIKPIKVVDAERRTAPTTVRPSPAPVAIEAPRASEPWRDWIAEKRAERKLAEFGFEDDGTFAKTQDPRNAAWNPIFRDGAIRATWKLPSEVPSVGQTEPSISLRKGSPDTGTNVSYGATIGANAVRLDLHTWEADRKADRRELGRWPLPVGFDRTQEHTFEFRAVAELFTISLNGQQLGTVRDPSAKEGSFAFSPAKGAAIRKMEYLSLDPPAAKEAPSPSAPVAVVVPAPVALPVKGVVDILPLVDVKRDRINGSWLKQNGELLGSGNSFARLALPGPVPEEYDFRVRFTRQDGNQAVSMHVVHGGHDVMWLMGGFENAVCAFEQVKGASGRDFPGGLKAGIENGRRYESVVKVRRGRIQVEMDGKPITDLATDGSDLAVPPPWSFPDPGKLGVGCQNRTIFHSIELIPVTAAVAGVSDGPTSPMPPSGAPGDSASAGKTAPPTMPAAVPTIPALSDPRLTQLANGFKARYDADAQKPFLAALASLNQSYVANGIGRARAAAQQKGALEEVTSLDAEKARILNNEGIPPADLDNSPDSLKILRTTYRSTLAKIEADRAKKAAPLYDLYIGAMDAYVAELTKVNKIEEARKVKALREDIAAQKPVVDDVVAAPASRPAVGNFNNNQKAADTVTNPGRSRWHEAARWVVSVGGSVRVSKNGQQMTVEKDSDIPPGRFDVLGVSISAVGNAKAVGIKDDDFTRLSGLKELNSFTLRGAKVGDAAFAFLPTAPAVTDIVLEGVPVTDAVLTHIAPLRLLTKLDIQGAPQFTGAGLENLASLPTIKVVWFADNGLSDAGIKALAGAKNLEHIRIVACPVTDEGIASFGSLKKLSNIHLLRCPQIRGATIAGWEGLASLTILDLSCPIRAETLSSIARLINLRELGLENVSDLSDESVPMLATLTKLTRFNASGTKLTGIGFSALKGCTQMKQVAVQYGTPISTEGLATIVAAFPGLEQLSLSSDAIQGADFHPLTSLKSLKILGLPVKSLDDTAMAEVGRIASLESFYTADSAVTGKGIAFLKPLKFLTKLNVPNCKGIDNAALPAFKDLKLLSELEIRSTGITDAGLSELKQAMPQCQITR